MRIRRSVIRIFWLALPPMMSVAMIAYFGYPAWRGERGYAALQTTEAQLAQELGRQKTFVAERKRLEHRIELLQSGDPDIVEELARTQLMDGAPGQVAVPRETPGK
jgi:cell division protein FtsB